MQRGSQGAAPRMTSLTPRLDRFCQIHLKEIYSRLRAFHKNNSHFSEEEEVGVFYISLQEVSIRWLRILLFIQKPGVVLSWKRPRT